MFETSITSVKLILTAPLCFPNLCCLILHTPYTYYKKMPLKTHVHELCFSLVQVLHTAEAFQKILREEEKRRRKEDKRKEIRKGPRISRSRTEL